MTPSDLMTGHAETGGKPEAELAVDVQLASRAVSGRFESADKRPKVRVEALRVRGRGLCGDCFRILEGSHPRKQTVQIAPGVGFGACERRVRVCNLFSRRHRWMIPKAAMMCSLSVRQTDE